MPPQDMVVGRTTLPGVKDCPIAGDKLPLVVISHGRGGDFIGHHDTAETLADAGFIVAAISHPGDTVSDMSRSGDLSVTIERPTDIKRLIDFMVGRFARRIQDRSGTHRLLRVLARWLYGAGLGRCQCRLG
jgi:predicted dienelactone hydrolase